MNNLPLDSLFFPSQVPSTKLIIVLHGRGDSAEGFRFFPEELGFKDVKYLLGLKTHMKKFFRKFFGMPLWI